MIAVSTATDTKAVTLGDGADVSAYNSDVAISLASGANVTVNGVRGLSATDTTITPVRSGGDDFGVAFTPGSGTVSFSENTVFKGGKASISSYGASSPEQITLFSDASVTSSASTQEFTVDKSAAKMLRLQA